MRVCKTSFLSFQSNDLVLLMIALKKMWNVSPHGNGCVAGGPAWHWRKPQPMMYVRTKPKSSGTEDFEVMLSQLDEDVRMEATKNKEHLLRILRGSDSCKVCRQHRSIYELP